MRMKNLLLLGLILAVFTACNSQTEQKEDNVFLPHLKSDLLKKEDKGKLIFTFASLAYTEDDSHGKVQPEEGMERLATIAHKYDIPVTWLVDLGTGKAMKSKLDEWHDKFGDDIGVSSRGEDERHALKQLFPWSEVSILEETTHKGDETYKAKELGFSTIWGSCWEQVGIDGITDRGAPWGSFYVSDENYKIPSLKEKGVVSVEWTSRDLLKALHSGRPTIYSSDPNDVARAGICSGDDIAYWKTMFDNYIRNIAYNKFVFFQQQQESHEMVNNDEYKIYTQAQIDEAAKMLDKFFAYVKSFDDLVAYKTIPEAVKLYTDNYNETAPSVMFFDDAPVKKPVFGYGRENRAAGPWPKTLLYYDKECQLAFIDGKFKPILDRDYVHNRTVNDPNYYQVDYKPELKLNISWRDVELTEIPINIKSEKAMPYGVSFWYDFNQHMITNVEGAELIGPIENQVALLRLNLKKGLNKIIVHLKRNNGQ